MTKLLTLAATLSLCLCTLAQQPAAPEGTPYTLHVDTNLVQLPTLVLNDKNQSIPNLAREQFSITLDRGAPFPPTLLHIAGDDPISLGVLLDASGPESELFYNFALDFAPLASVLRPQDRVTFFALDCSLIRSSIPSPVTSASLAEAITHILSVPQIHGQKNKPSCGGSLAFWDSAATAISALATQPGRRVLLMISEGEDHNSNLSRDQFSSFAASKSVALFAIRDAKEHAVMKDLHYPAGLSSGTREHDTPTNDPLTFVCEKNGGTLTNITASEMAPALQSFLTMLRGRYILEFPDPYLTRPGAHRVLIKLRDIRARALSTGVYAPLRDAAKQ